MIAVVKTGGKQYLLKEGEELRIEKLPGDKDDAIALTEVLLLAQDDGSEVKIGTPTVSGAKVTAKVLEQGRGKKVTIIKFKSKVRFRRKAGHRQPYTKLKIEKI